VRQVGYWQEFVTRCTVTKIYKTIYLFCDSCCTHLQHELLRSISDFADSWPASLVTNIHWPTYRLNK